MIRHIGPPLLNPYHTPRDYHLFKKLITSGWKKNYSDEYNLSGKLAYIGGS